MPWTFAGVIVSTVPTSSPVAGLNDSSAGFGLAFAFDRFVEDFVVLSPLEPDFRLAPVLRVPLASITASSRRLRSSRTILRGANTSSQRWEETAYRQRPPAEAAPPSYPCASSEEDRRPGAIPELPAFCVHSPATYAPAPANQRRLPERQTTFRTRTSQE